MSILTVDVGGANEMDVDCERAGHAPPRVVGEKRYTAAGRERSMEKAELQTVPVVIRNLQQQDARTVRALFANGAQVVCNGVVFNNGLADVICSGEITDEAEVGTDDGDDLYWIINITLSEVRNASTVLWVTPP
jgi:hypothetical protein